VQQAEGRIVSTSMFTRCPRYVIGGALVVKCYVLRGNLPPRVLFQGRDHFFARAVPASGYMKVHELLDTRSSRSSCNSVMLVLNAL